jgi:5-methylcytosine-specific restriction endonuclease McrA
VPIRAERLALYPPDWPEISARVRESADHKCEFCGIRNGVWGYRDDAGKFHECSRDGFGKDYGRPPFWFGAHRIIAIVLTTAHLDHNESNCDYANLKALCQRCHLRYDAKHHARNAAETRRKKMRTLDLLDEA